MSPGTGKVLGAGSEARSSIASERPDTASGGAAFRWIAATLLGAAGFLINFLPVQLSPGTDMVFGGIPALLAAVALGPVPGLLAGVIASSRTVWIWGHPYGWLIFSLEAFAVGFLVRRYGMRPMVGDLIFWAVAGIPIVYVTSTYGLGAAPVTFGVFALKQTLNGLFNAVLVELLMLLPFIRWSLRIPGAPRLQSAIAVVVTTAAILPALIFGIWVGRVEWTRSLERAEERVVVYSQAYASKLEQFVLLHESSVRSIAGALEQFDMLDTDELQQIVTVAHRQFPSFVMVQAADSRGIIVASHANLRDSTAFVGMDSSERPYFERLRALRATLISDVLRAGGETGTPVIVVAHPVVVADSFAGYVLGAVDLNALPQPIPLPEDYERLQVADGQGVMIFDSHRRIRPAAPIQLLSNVDVFGRITAVSAPGIAIFSPSSGQAASAGATTDQLLAGVARIPGLGWWVWMEEPFARIQAFVAESHLRLFGLLIAVSLLGLLVSTALARYLSNPLLRLRTAAGALAAGDLVARVGRLPIAMPTEIRELGSGFDEMAAALTGRHEELEELGDIARSLASTLDLQTLLPRITEAAERLVDPDGCGIALVSDAGNKLRSADYTLGVMANTAGQEVPLDGSVTGWVVRTGRSVLIRETRGDSRIDSSYVDADRIRSVICAPLVGRSGVLGALTAVRARESARTFSDADLQLLERLAGNAAVAVENARLLEAAEAASRAKSAFIATMSHELRTPLNGVLGNLELLEIGVYGDLSSKQKESIARMQTATQQLRSLIEEVLSFSRMEAGRIEVALMETDLQDVLREVEFIIEPVSRAKGLAFAISAEDGDPVVTLTDPDKVRQILVYLAGNAVKFTEQGEVAIRMRNDGRQVSIAVSDTGVGIAPEHRGRLFMPFEQIDAGLERSHGGAGLGLYLSGRYAELIGGRIAVQSNPGVGSEFTLILPIRPGGQQASPSRAERMPSTVPGS